MTLSGLSAPGLAGWLLAPLLLLLIRPVLVGVLLVRSDLSRGERAFLGWFGVRGVAAVYYACVVVASGVLRPGEERTVFWTAVVCVAISIFLHGTTATAVSRRLLSQA